MRKRYFKIIIFVAMVSLVWVTSSIAQEARDLTIEEQLKHIIDAQNRIEMRLSTLDSRQKGILNAIRQGGIRGGARQAAPGGCGGGGGGGRPAIDYSKVHDIKIGSSPIRGKKDAKVTIVEFSEIQCPYAKKAHPTLLEVIKAYPNDVRFIFKHFPLGFHNQAKPGAKAMLAAGEQGKYWEMLDLLFAKGVVDRVQNEAPADLEKRLEEHYKSLAKELGLKVKKFVKDYKKDDKWEKIIAEDLGVAKSVGVGGTPTLFINGRRMGARDFQTFKKEIEKILKKKEEKKKK